VEGHFQPFAGTIDNHGAKPAWPGGCSGVVVNRTNGDVTIKLVALGLWRSADQGKNWQRIDADTISGRTKLAGPRVLTRTRLCAWPAFPWMDQRAGRLMA